MIVDFGICAEYAYVESLIVYAVDLLCIFGRYKADFSHRNSI